MTTRCERASRSLHHPGIVIGNDDNDCDNDNRDNDCEGDMADGGTTTGRALSATVSRAIHDIRLLANVDELRVGDRLPAERALAERLQVSRSTVRAALKAMRERGEIVTRGGRAGTVIAADIAHTVLPSRIDVNAKSARVIDRTSASTSGLPHMLASQGKSCVTTVLDARMQRCDERICTMFHCASSQPLIRVERARAIGNVPISYEQTYLDPRGYPDFLDFDMTASIYQLLQFNYADQLPDGVLKGGEKMWQFMIATMVDLVVRVGLSFAFAPTFGSMGIWMSWPFGWFLGAVCSQVFFFTNKWKLSARSAHDLEYAREQA